VLTTKATKNKKKGTKKFNGNCNSCGRKGHMARDCWENSNNADKRPTWYRPKEVTASGADHGSQNKNEELQLMNMSWKFCEEISQDDEESETNRNNLEFEIAQSQVGREQ
jgi:hypothetical protein